MNASGKITTVNGNMITVAFDGDVAQNEVGYAMLGENRLMAEIVRVRGRHCDMQVFESTNDLAVGDKVEFTGELLAAELGPGMLAQVYDGTRIRSPNSPPKPARFPATRRSSSRGACTCPGSRETGSGTGTRRRKSAPR